MFLVIFTGSPHTLPLSETEDVPKHEFVGKNLVILSAERGLLFQAVILAFIFFLIFFLMNAKLFFIYFSSLWFAYF